MAEKGTKRQRSASPHEESTKERKRIKLSSSEIRQMNREKLVAKWKEQESYIDSLLSKLESSSASEVAKLKDSESKLQLQVQESTRRENVLNMRLATKQQEMQDLMSQLHDLKQAQNSENAQLHQTLIDPAVNLVFERMKSQLSDYKEKLDQAQSDLSAWKFTPDSVTGKKLMAKCRSLMQENQELGKQISQGRVAQLEAEISLQRKFNVEIKASQDELSEFVFQLDEEIEAMQATLLHLEHQVKSSNLKESSHGHKGILDSQHGQGTLASPSKSGGSRDRDRDRTARATPNGPVDTHSTPNGSSLSSKIVSRSQTRDLDS